MGDLLFLFDPSADPLATALSVGTHLAPPKYQCRTLVWDVHAPGGTPDLSGHSSGSLDRAVEPSFDHLPPSVFHAVGSDNPHWL